MMIYEDFLATKRHTSNADPIAYETPLSSHLFPFQRGIVQWALHKGRAAIFADCGMGKTLMQLEWARHVPGRVLIVAPLAVGVQTEEEGRRFGISCAYRRSPGDDQITITNYEMLHRFRPEDYRGVVLDESSILKAFDGKTRNALINAFVGNPYRLACTATPSPNDYMELGNHSEFLGVMDHMEMLSMFFVHDGGHTQYWRLKRHAIDPFWRWVASWAVFIRMPSDLGYDDDGFNIPSLVMQKHCVDVEHDGSLPTLFPMPAASLRERIAARSASVSERCARAIAIASATEDQVIVWCALNAESNMISAAIDDSIEIVGADSWMVKEDSIHRFLSGEVRVLVTKPSIAGFGLNMQCCHRMVFVGLSDSYESYYQALRRCWRFGQKKNVQVDIVYARTEGAVIENIARKEAQFTEMAKRIVASMKTHTLDEFAAFQGKKEALPYTHKSASGNAWEMHLADCVDVLKLLQESSIHYSVFSPPFASLYVYSDSERDMGNVASHQQFFQHFGFAIRELYRVLMPGRLLSFHCMNLPTSKARDGIIGLTDFRGQLIAAFRDAGFVYHSEVCIWKDPVTAMQRTKAIGLLHKQLKKDSCLSRQGIADYLVTMRKPGDNPEPVSHSNQTFPVREWQHYASPIWTDINPSETLQYRSARAEEDERHICPLQLEVIRRALRLWTNPGDLVLSPFAGIGSEGFISLQMGRRFLGCELKQSYWEQACANLANAERQQKGLFAESLPPGMDAAPEGPGGGRDE